MTRFFSFSAALLLSISPALAANATAQPDTKPAPAAHAAKASAPEHKGSYPTALFCGTWAMMSAADAIEVAANRAMGPAARLLLTLPPMYSRVVKQEHFSLSRVDGASWTTSSPPLKLTFTLQSENTALLVIDSTDGHKMELPLYRDDTRTQNP